MIGERRWGWQLLFDRGFWSAVGSKGLEEALLFVVVWLVEVAVWALVEAAVLFPVTQLVTVCTESSPVEFLQDLFEFSEERECVDLVKALYEVGL